MNYYNDNDDKCCAWITELIKAGLIPPGHVDSRSITEIKPADLHGYTQCHFFCGIAGWPYALHLAGVDPDEPLWTGSCPCQPYSSAGSQLGDADPRNLWPAFFNLIRQCRPLRIIGEQVENAIGHGWLDNISADLEAEGYACGAIVLGAHSLGAPHRRQRLYWMANAEHAQWRAERFDGGNGRNGADQGRSEAHGVVGACGEVCGVAEPKSQGRSRVEPECETGEREWARLGSDCAAGQLDDAPSPRRDGPQSESEGIARDETRLCVPGESGAVDRMEHAARERREQRRAESGERGAECGREIGWLEHATSGGAHAGEQSRQISGVEQAGPNGVAQDDTDFPRPQGQQQRGNRANERSPWATGVAHHCTDGKQRLIEPSAFPLAHGVSGRVGLLRGYGNAIVPQAAATFIQAALPQICQVGRTDIRVNEDISRWDAPHFG